MKLNDVYTKPLKDVVEELNLTDMKVHTDDDGEVRSIELKYEPNNRITKGAQSCYIKRNRPQDSSGIQISKGRGREGSVQHSCGAGCQGGANKGIRKALRTRTSGTGTITNATGDSIIGGVWI